MSPHMTGRRLFAILFVFAATSLAWFTLGISLVERSGSSSERLDPEVSRLWGGPQAQQAPTVHWLETVVETESVVETAPDGQPRTRSRQQERQLRHPLPLASSQIDVELALEHRRKGLLWYDLYTVEFDGSYTVQLPADAARTIEVRFAFPSADAMYDGFEVRLGERAAEPVGELGDGVTLRLDAAAGEIVPIDIRYRSRGLDRWSYELTAAGVAQVQRFRLTATTDAAGIDFPAGGLSPTAKSPAGNGWRLDWRFDSLVTGKQIAIDLPNRLNPGPLAARITFFAPVSLLFFITVLVILGMVERRNLHPMHYFFLAAAFFAFHLLLAYLVDHLDIHAAFAVSAAVSLALVLSYLRLVAGNRFAFRRAGLAQLVYLVLFNYAFFFEGFTGLTVTVGAVITLFVLMQLTARVDWAELLGRPAATDGA